MTIPPKHGCTRTHRRGFVAMMSVIIISAVLLVIMCVLNTASFMARFDTLDTENKQESYNLAESCARTAMLRLAQDPSYAPASGGDCVSLGGTCGGSDPQKVCRICSISAGSFPKTVVLRAKYNSTYTNLRIVVTNPSMGEYGIARWIEEPWYAGTTCIVP